MPISDVFVIMPFGAETVVLNGKKIVYDSSHFDDVYELIKAAVTSFDPAIRVERMEKKHGNLVSAIIRRIHSAELVVAVLSGRNPNVFYELGVRHALRRGTIMLVSDRNEYPFDLKGYYSEQYSISTGKERKQLESFIVERLKEYSAGMLDDSPVLDVLEVSEREQWRSINNWETRRAAVVLRHVLGNLTLVFEWVGGWMKEVARWVPDMPEDFEPRQVGNIGIDTLQNFAQTAPIIGLPSHAYIDASNISVMLRELQTNLADWDMPSAVDRFSEMEDAERVAFANFARQKLIRFTGNCILFADDVCAALEYVIKTREAHSIPWRDSMDRADEIDSLDALREIQDGVVSRVNAVREVYMDFENRFSGAPPRS